METGLSLGSGVNSVIDALQARNPEIVYSAQTCSAWNSVANEAQQAHTEAVFVVPRSNGSEVVIYTDTAIWATELNMQVELLRLKMNLALRDEYHEGDPERIRSLRFAVSKEKYRSNTQGFVGMSRESLDEGMHIDANPLELTPQELARLEQQVAAIENQALREAAFQAAKASLELRKGSGEAL